MATNRPCLGTDIPPLSPPAFPVFPPPFPSLAKRPADSPASPSRSRSRSPVRQVPAAYQLDPLLRSLSPEATLQALSTTDAVPNREKAAHDILSQSISQVSQADRALGIRAAVAAKNLSLWYKEVQSWGWPKRHDAHLGKSFVPPSPETVADPSVEYYGSLPASVVVKLEARIEEIRDGMDSLGVEDLKEHVLNAHIPSRSRPSSSNSTMSIPPPLSYVQLSDFTAVVTATILRALPILSRLNALLSTWDVRLLVLRQIPGLLRNLCLTRSSIDDAFRALHSSGPLSENDALYSRSNFYAKQAELGAAVVSTGRRMDNILDALEGREDSLPERWIDDLEAIESDFSSWVVEAEKRSVENEWTRLNARGSPDGDHPSRLDQSTDETSQVSTPVSGPVSVSGPAEPESARHNGRPFLMETIQEEPSSACVSDSEAKDPSLIAPQTPVGPGPERSEDQTQQDEQFPASSQQREESLSDEPKSNNPLTQAETERGTIDEHVQHESPADVSPKPAHEASDHVPVSDARKPVDDEPQTGSPKALETTSLESNAVEQPDESTLATPVAAKPALPTVPVIREQSSSSSSPSPSPSQSLSPSLSKPHSEEGEIAVQEQDASPPPPKQPLESPIKLKKTRAPKLDTSKRRRASNTSADSLSDFPSLISSPEIREVQETSPNGTPVFLDTPPQFPRVHVQPDSRKNDHTLREDSLRRFDDQKDSPRMVLRHNRAVSLPMQRFIDERMDYENDAGGDADSSGAGRRPSSSVASHLEHHQEHSKNPVETNSIQRLASQRIGHAHEAKPSSRPKSRVSETGDRKKKAPLRNAAERSLNSQPTASARLSKGLHAHRSVDSLRNPGQDSRQSRANTPVETLRKNGSGSSTPGRGSKKNRDQLDEKISTILDALPTRIQLVSHDDSDASSVTSSIAPMKTRERFRSVSPGAVSTRTSTFAPSMTLTPAMSRRRQSSAHGPEESSVKLYHLHKGGKTNPTKLFVRTVGENGERVMVRVGGGWADLGEYLREYAIHHGRRHVSDTPRVEVRGLSSPRDSPGSQNNNMLTPTPHHTGDRPRSVLSNRPSSSLGVRKTRRASNVSDTGADNIRAVSMGDSPLSSSASRRRLSASSNNSFGATSLPSEAHPASSVYSPSTTIAAGGSTLSTPLGLAGPKPRSRQVSMSPESEAWVEDVLGQARRSSLRPVPGDHQMDGHGQGQGTPPAPSPRVVTKVRSVGDMSMRSVSDMAGRRVALQGLGRRPRY